MYKPVSLRLCSITSVSDMQLVFMFSKYQLHTSMPYVHCLLLIVSSSRSQSSGSEGFDLKGSFTDLNLHCSDLVHWKYINSLNFLWNQLFGMGPFRWSNPEYTQNFRLYPAFGCFNSHSWRQRRNGGTQWVQGRWVLWSGNMEQK